MKSRLRRLAGFVVPGCGGWVTRPPRRGAAAEPPSHSTHRRSDLHDPTTTRAYITRNHGYMVYDTLFAMDEKFQVKPQMVDKFDVSKDQLTYTFTLRDGLKFHDGQPVRSADCIASIDRWSKRDALGQKLAEATDRGGAVDDKTFRLKLKNPFPAHAGSARQAVVERAVHHARAYCQDRSVQEYRRSDRLGAFQVRRRRNGCPATRWSTSRTPTTCRARSRRPGPQAAKSSRSTELNGSTFPIRPPRPRRFGGRSRLVGKPAADLIPLLSKNKDINVKNIDPMGSMGMIRFNFLHPPFNNVKMRQALLYAVNQQDYVIGIAGDPKNGNPCYSYFTCGTPLASEVAADPLKGKRDWRRRSS